MKKLVEVTEVQGEGLEKLMGERVTLFCANYVYTGKLIGVNASCVLLKTPASFTRQALSLRRIGRICRPCRRRNGM